MDIDFECTICGQCCHDLRLPLTVNEALAWLERGGEVQILCEAVPWPEEPPTDNLQATQKRRRSFAALSGSLATRVVVILAAAYTGPCPNLQPDMRCGIYAQRPLVCRIYPAEVNPFISLTPAHKACPPDAWAPGSRPLLRGGTLVDADLVPLIQQARDADVQEVPIKQRLCELLGIDRAAVSSEGMVAHAPDRDTLLVALEQARHASAAPAALPAWRFISRRHATVEVLVSVGAVAYLADADSAPGFEYLGFSAADH